MIAVNISLLKSWIIEWQLQCRGILFPSRFLKIAEIEHGTTNSVHDVLKIQIQYKDSLYLLEQQMLRRLPSKMGKYNFPLYLFYRLSDFPATLKMGQGHHNRYEQIKLHRCHYHAT